MEQDYKSRLRNAAQAFLDKHGLWNDSVMAYDAYINGAEWGVRNIWTDGSVLPELSEPFIYINADGVTSVGIVINEQDRGFCWELWQPKKWCYLKDLGITDARTNGKIDL